MRNLLLAATALTVVSAPAFAADLPARTAPVAPVAYAPAFTWSGFYVGVNAGYGWADGTDVFVTSPTGVVSAFSGGNNGGFTGGGQIGYNFQTGAIVFGLETDIQYADFGGGRTFAPSLVTTDSGSYWGSVRGRLGFAADRALFYVTGGLAYGDIGESVFGNNDVRVGWTLGGGVEYAFTNNWTAKVEGLYVDIDRGNKAGAITTNGVLYTATQSSDSGFGVVRAGLNYKF